MSSSFILAFSFCWFVYVVKFGSSIPLLNSRFMIFRFVWLYTYNLFFFVCASAIKPDCNRPMWSNFHTNLLVYRFHDFDWIITQTFILVVDVSSPSGWCKSDPMCQSERRVPFTVVWWYLQNEKKEHSIWNMSSYKSKCFINLWICIRTVGICESKEWFSKKFIRQNQSINMSTK